MRRESNGARNSHQELFHVILNLNLMAVEMDMVLPILLLLLSLLFFCIIQLNIVCLLDLILHVSLV